MNKKGTVVLYLSLVGFIIALVTFFVITLQQPSTGTDYVGQASLDVIKAKQEYDKAVFYLDQASTYASEDLVYDFFSMQQDFGCGYSIDKQYVVVKKFGKLCITKQKIADGFVFAFENSLHKYTSNYPNQDVSFPVSYKLIAKEDSLGIVSEDNIIVNIGDIGGQESSVNGESIKNYADYAEFLKKTNKGIAYVEYIGDASGGFNAPRDGRLHKGYDIAMPAGSKVYAAYDGTVVETNIAWGGDGFAVWVLDSDGKLAISYGHLILEPSIKIGKKMRAGDYLGKINKDHVDIKRWVYHAGESYAPYAIKWEPGTQPTQSAKKIDETDSFIIADPALKKRVNEEVVDLKPVIENFKKYNLEPIIEKASKAHNIDINLVKAIIAQESGGNPKAISSTGAQGLMQLMPDTAKGLGVADSYNPEQNIDGGTKYIKQLLDKFDGKLEFALAAYNAGPGAVEQYKAIPPYPETRTYVARVIRHYQEFGGSTTSFGKNTDTGAVKYSQKYIFKVPYKFDVLGEYEKLMNIADESSKKVIDCLKKGSEQPDDNDVDTCTKLIAGLAGGETAENVFYLKFEFPTTFKPSKTKEKDEKIRFAYLIEDNIPPPQLKDLIIRYDKNADSVEIKFINLASDTAKYYIYCNKESETPAVEEMNAVRSNNIAEGNVLLRKNLCSGKKFEAGKYSIKIVAEDKAGNKIDENEVKEALLSIQ
ncbi:MAG TPA: transglycosylase SLT domain-containing protein [Candidatus Nanoarchaeia archaeon]|nr:transglycosylase SLT domain-containing protein [Candidatus Nanoarchaeia archaeon]